MQIGFVRLRTVEEAKRAIQGMNGYREKEGCTPWCLKVFFFYFKIFTLFLNIFRFLFFSCIIIIIIFFFFYYVVCGN
jgi:hypothetical protein